ncbi:hypothetical protein Ancab_039788 [Ancistrocladus abbreviatus]
MDNPRENNNWKAVPEFGKWDDKSGANPNYSVVFSQARANRKHAKNDVKHLSLGGHEELVAQTPSVFDPPARPRHQDDSAVVRLFIFPQVTSFVLSSASASASASLSSCVTKS